ncbi:DUF7344 domain-containing protein [Halomarina litorea]|uniref:DUF7344 domain-containing protein n=1 Tax=Halomarina litorea TaxID=2961595 RepID=UPI0020C58810|nr:hypothetical protein [Halomarina sp. BCD28]
MRLSDTDITDSSAETDRLLRAIADEDRRGVLEHLCAADGPVDVTDLAEVLVDHDASSRASGPDDPETAAAATVLHCHLPALETASLVRFDAEASVAEATVDPADLDAVTSQVPDVGADGRGDGDGDEA